MTPSEEKQLLLRRVNDCTDPDLIRRALLLFELPSASMGNGSLAAGDPLAQSGSMSREEFLKRLRG